MALRGPSQRVAIACAGTSSLGGRCGVSHSRICDTSPYAANMSDAPTAQSANHFVPSDVVVRGNPRAFLQNITVGKHHLQADEPFSIGGNDSAPDPYDYLLAGLGACTSMTIGLYARRSKWPLDNIIVTLRHSRMHASDCADCDTKIGMLDRIEVEIKLVGEITPEQRTKLMQIAHKCPVHRTLKGEIKIDVRGAESAK